MESTKITPFLWFDNQAEKAVNFYTSIFPNSEILQLKKWPEGGPYSSDSIQLGSFILDGVKFHAFDAGPQFKFNPSISFFVVCETAAEVNKLWAGFIEGGKALMALDSYPWSERYGWLTDQFGVSWQLMKGKLAEVGQRITPLLMFSGSQKGRAEEAIKFYMSVFENSSLDGIAKYGPEVPANEGMVMHGQGKLMGQTFMVMDSGEDNDHPFNEAISFFTSCKDQQEVDYYWNRLTADGGSESMWGWLKDKFGVSWQIVPELVAEKMTSGDPDKLEKMFQALLQMKKLIVADLEKAYNA
jgi:predicted 3-demethylubiquinone-9 3-methyltransferase (glyoxalase superfamily)